MFSASRSTRGTAWRAESSNSLRHERMTELADLRHLVGEATGRPRRTESTLEIPRGADLIHGAPIGLHRNGKIHDLPRLPAHFQPYGRILPKLFLCTLLIRV